MTVVDTGVVVRYLLRGEPVDEIVQIFRQRPPPVAPDVVIFECLATIRRIAFRGDLQAAEAEDAVKILGELPLALFGSLPLRIRAWELRENMTAADALFVALAEKLGEPLATKDRALAAAARQQTDVDVVELTADG